METKNAVILKIEFLENLNSKKKFRLILNCFKKDVLLFSSVDQNLKEGMNISFFFEEKENYIKIWGVNVISDKIERLALIKNENDFVFDTDYYLFLKIKRIIINNAGVYYCNKFCIMLSYLLEKENINHLFVLLEMYCKMGLFNENNANEISNFEEFKKFIKYETEMYKTITNEK